MANEAVILKTYGNDGDVADYTVADGTAIAMGALCKITDPETAALSAASTDSIAGIAKTAKEASDGSTRLGLYTNVDAKMYASGAIAAGAAVISAADANFPNYVKSATGVTAASAANIIGYAKETAADRETLVVRVRL